MVVISKAILRDFGLEHPDVVESLNYWYTITKQQDWDNFSDLKNAFNSVDYVGNDRYVFNIKGNRYRMVAMILFDIRTVFIRFIGTHAEYDNTNVSTI